MCAQVRGTFKVDPIHSMTDLETRVQDLGFFPMFECAIRGFSVYENTPGFWNDLDEGPWGWKGPMIRAGNVGYGKFFNRKAGYVSLEWLPDFLNYRRSRHLAPNDDAQALDDIILQSVQIEGTTTIKELRQLLGLGSRKRRADDLVVDSSADVKINLDTNLTRLMMEGRVCIADFVYNTDKRGNRYGWGIAKYTTPELLYGRDIIAACAPQESLERILGRMRKILPMSNEQQINKLIII